MSEMSEAANDDDDWVPTTGDDETGPYLMIAPEIGLTGDQMQAAMAAARELFDQAGRDPVNVAYNEDQSGMKTLWDTAERAASKAAGTPVKLAIFFE